jgi:hypothetical protein
LALGACGASALKPAPHGSADAAAGRRSARSAADRRSGAGTFRVVVARASFPAQQRLAEQTQLVIAVRNAGSRTIPDIAVTLLNPANGTGALALAHDIAPNQGETLAERSRPIWIIDRNPGPCQYSCRQGGFGAAAIADANTWALGPLAPGRTATFEWQVTAMVPGRWTVAYRVAADLSGNARIVTPSGSQPTGRFDVVISAKPQQSYVNNGGQIVTTG